MQIEGKCPDADVEQLATNVEVSYRLEKRPLRQSSHEIVTSLSTDVNN